MLNPNQNALVLPTPQMTLDQFLAKYGIYPSRYAQPDISGKPLIPYIGATKFPTRAENQWWDLPEGFNPTDFMNLINQWKGAYGVKPSIQGL